MREEEREALLWVLLFFLRQARESREPGARSLEPGARVWRYVFIEVEKSDIRRSDVRRLLGFCVSSRCFPSTVDREPCVSGYGTHRM